MTTIKYGILIVLYKKNLYESETFTSLVKNKNKLLLDVFIWDNSPEKNNIENIESTFCSFTYFHDGKNYSLAYIYNKVLDNFFINKSVDYSIVLDHDTLLMEDHTKILTEDIYDNGHPFLMVPIAKNIQNNQIISPRRNLSDNSIKQNSDIIHKPGWHQSANFFAVGSGITISKSLWRSGLRFDENLSLYGVDEEFCIEYSKAHNYIYTSRAEVLHNICSDNDSKIQRCKRIINLNNYRCYRIIKHNYKNNYYSKLRTKLNFTLRTLRSIIKVSLS